MKILYIPLKEIQFETKKFDDTLAFSISRISLSFPIKVKKIENGYLCIDGHKRLSAIKWLIDQHTNTRDFTTIPAILVSNARTDNGWSRKRYH